MLTGFSSSQSVLLFVGGSGITFATPVLEEIVGQASNGACRTRSVTLVWTMKSLDCVSWYQDMLNDLLAHAKSHTVLSICIKLCAQNNSLSTQPPPGRRSFAHAPTSPLIEDAVSDVLAGLTPSLYDRGAGISVGRCGPEPLVKTVRLAVGKVWRARAVKACGITTYSEGVGW